MSPTHPLSRNLDAYNAYHALVSLWAWIPIFYFYLTQFLPLQDVVRLQAIYYAAVVAMEVPSGYFSDRLGRRLTLVLASSFLVASYGMFILVDSFAGFVVAEVLLAAGFAFQSGTDTALLYDSLKELGRDSEYLEREARSQRYAMSAAALAALIGGVTGWIDLRLAYVLSLLGALGSWFLAYRFVEPSRSGHTAGFAKQLRLCVECLKQPLLLWLFAFFVVMYALEHIPFEFYQPYIQLLDASFRGLLEGPPISGAVIAVSMFRWSVRGRTERTTSLAARSFGDARGRVPHPMSHHRSAGECAPRRRVVRDRPPQLSDGSRPRASVRPSLRLTSRRSSARRICPSRA